MVILFVDIPLDIRWLFYWWTYILLDARELFTFKMYQMFQNFKKERRDQIKKNRNVEALPY